MLAVETMIIAPDENTAYLVGPEGLVWTVPAMGGDAFILAARDDAERARAVAFVGVLLDMGLVPYGVPLNQRGAVAMFGGPPTRGCRWVPWNAAPAPEGDPGDELPTVAAVLVSA